MTTPKGTNVTFVFEYSGEMKEKTLDADGIVIHTGESEPYEYGKLEVYAGDERIGYIQMYGEQSAKTSRFGKPDEAKRVVRLTSAKKGYNSLIVGFSSDEEADDYDKWVESVMEEGRTPEARAYFKAEQKKREKEKAEREAKIAKREAERNRVLSQVREVNTVAKEIVDEGGKTTQYIHAITTHDGNVYKFSDRNVFDVGRIINPMYDVDGHSGCICLNENGVHYWQHFVNGKGWATIRPLNDDELVALEVLQWVGFANARIRM
jgi:hypothetical protein